MATDHTAHLYTELEEAQQLYSDFHKELYGFRPRSATADQWADLAWLQAQIADLDRAAVGIRAEEAAQEADAIATFEAAVARSMQAGAPDRATAVRWLREATGDEYAMYDDGMFEYANGLPYGYLKRTTI